MVESHGIDLQVQPLKPERWADLERLFGPRGASGGCWCMWWRLDCREFARQKGEGNRQALRTLVEGGEVPGLLAFVGDEPAGWCALAPRERYPRLERSRPLARVDARPVWSVTCFFVARPFRRHGVMGALLEAAKEYARACGAALLEAYPIDPAVRSTSAAQAYMGLLPVFLRAGFVEVTRRVPARPLVRCVLTLPPGTETASRRTV